MENCTIACFDVYYHQDWARACCIIFKIKPQEKIISQYIERIRPIHAYIPGEFYKRELPCLLRVYDRVREDIDLAVIDGFVFVEGAKKGLGGHLYKALDEKIPVIGVAKTFYQGCRNYIKLYRGKSQRPLFISSIGLDLNFAAELIKNLAGENRIPDILKKVDRLTRQG